MQWWMFPLSTSLIVRDEAPLEAASRYGQKEAVKLLLAIADVDYQASPSLLICAAQNGHIEVVELLLMTSHANFDINDCDGEGSTSLSKTSGNGCRELVEPLLTTASIFSLEFQSVKKL